MIAILGATPRAFAEPAAASSVEASSATPPGDVVPPRLLGVTVPYPETGKGDATVVLEVVVDRTGAVRNAQIVSGDAPFSDAALSAITAARFSPASRGEVPISARIRLALTFHAPNPAPPLPAPETPKATNAPPASGPAEVRVEGVRPEPAETNLDRTEIQRIPGAFGDAFRALEARPGVVPVYSGVPYFFVRGSPPGNVGYFIDDIRVPLIFHAGGGPAVVPSALVDEVHLYPGGYPARYGGFAGAIVAGDLRPPASEAHAEGLLRVVDVGGVAEAPLLGGRATVLASGRYGYAGPVIRLFSPNTLLDYWDYQARGTLELGKHDSVGVFAFGADDFLGSINKDGSRDVAVAAQFHRLDLRYDHRADDGTAVRVAGTWGLDHSYGESGLDARDHMVAARTVIEHPLGRTVRLRGGASVTRDSYDLVPDGASETAYELGVYFPSRIDVNAGAWTDAVVDVASNLRITPGLRADYYEFGSHSTFAVDPRVASELTVAPGLALLETFGVAHQPPSFVIPIPGLAMATGPLQTSVQHSFGVKKSLPADVSLTVTGFHDVMMNLTDVGSLATSPEDLDPRHPNIPINDRYFGSSYGLEVEASRPLTRRLGGFVTYTLSRSLRSGGRQNQFPSSFDRTHVLQTAVGYDLGRRWHAGARVLFYTGIPNRTLQTPYEAVTPLVPGMSPNGTLLVPGPQHLLVPVDAGRLPPFFRLDLRLEKRWPLGEHGHVALVFEVLNATLAREYVAHGRQTGPITIPSVGLEAAI